MSSVLRSSREPLVRIVDDDASLREALGLVLTVGRLDWAGYESAEAFLERDDLRRPGVVVLDLRMTGMSGLACQAKLAERASDLPVLFLTGHGDATAAVRALKAGAVDFLQKPVGTEKLLSACRRLTAWHLALRAENEEREHARTLLATLTPREREAADYTARGWPNRTIAEEMGVSEQAVKIHRSNIYRKLGVKGPVDVAELMRKADPDQRVAQAGLRTLCVLADDTPTEEK